MGRTRGELTPCQCPRAKRTEVEAPPGCAITYRRRRYPLGYRIRWCDRKTDTLCATPGDYNAYTGSDGNAKCGKLGPGIPVHVINIKNDYEAKGKTNIPPCPSRRR
jgi:hypothetical protein